MCDNKSSGKRHRKALIFVLFLLSTINLINLIKAMSDTIKLSEQIANLLYVVDNTQVFVDNTVQL
jgi:hypothetical protein